MISNVKLYFGMSLASAILVFIAILAYAAGITPAVKSQGTACPQDGGACATWTGTKNYDAGSGLIIPMYWGPGAGWIVGVIVFCLTLAWSILSLLCSSDDSDNERA